MFTEDHEKQYVKVLTQKYFNTTDVIKLMHNNMYNVFKNANAINSIAFLDKC